MYIQLRSLYKTIIHILSYSNIFQHFLQYFFNSQRSTSKIPCGNRGVYGIIFQVIYMFSVIFDMDGTLFDTQRIFIPAWDSIGESLGIKDMGKHIPAVCGMNKEGGNAYLREHFPGIDAEAFRKAESDYVEKNLVVKFMPGAPELLKFLKERGIKTALATGTSRESTEHHLKETGISGYFDAMVCGGEVKNGKPAPDIFLEAARLLNEKPQNCFVLEDSLNGIKAGYNAGMKCIGVPDIVSFTDEDRKLMFAQIKRLDEAIDIFKRLIDGKQENIPNKDIFQ